MPRDGRQVNVTALLESRKTHTHTPVAGEEKGRAPSRQNLLPPPPHFTTRSSRFGPPFRPGRDGERNVKKKRSIVEIPLSGWKRARNPHHRQLHPSSPCVYGLPMETNFPFLLSGRCPAAEKGEDDDHNHMCLSSSCTSTPTWVPWKSKGLCCVSPRSSLCIQCRFHPIHKMAHE